jgi:Tol biopolymer transport system component
MGRIWVARADGTDAHAVTATMPVPRFLSWKPDGHAIAFASDVTGAPGIWTVDLRTRELRALAKGTSPAWSPNGRRIAYLTGDSQGAQLIEAVPPAGGPPALLLRAYSLGPAAQELVWSPDGTAIRVGASLVSTDGRATVTPTTTLEWSPDGSFVLTRDPATRRLTLTDRAGDPLGAAPPLLHPHIAPDGTAVAGATVSGKVVIVTVGRGAQHSAPHAQSLHDQVSWSRALVAYAGGGRCGRRSEIDAVRKDGSGFRVVVRAC